jgi:hypothetical protein
MFAAEKSQRNRRLGAAVEIDGFYATISFSIRIWIRHARLAALRAREVDGILCERSLLLNKAGLLLSFA